MPQCVAVCLSVTVGVSSTFHFPLRACGPVFDFEDRFFFSNGFLLFLYFPLVRFAFVLDLDFGFDFLLNGFMYFRLFLLRNDFERGENAGAPSDRFPLGDGGGADGSFRGDISSSAINISSGNISS